MANLNEYYHMIEGLTTYFQGVGQSIKGTNAVKNLVELKNVTRNRLAKTSRIIKLKKHKYKTSKK